MAGRKGGGRIPETRPAARPQRPPRRLPLRRRRRSSVEPALQAGPAPAVAETASAPVSSGLQRLLWVGLGAGVLFSVATFALALVLLVRQERFEAATARAADASILQRQSAADRGAAATSLKVAIGARHRGKGLVDVSARLSLQQKPLFKAEVVAFLDMEQMPGAHKIGPLKMVEAAGTPGLYTTRASVPMVGDWTVRVQSLGPVRGEGTKEVSVGVASPSR